MWCASALLGQRPGVELQAGIVVMRAREQPTGAVAKDLDSAFAVTDSSPETRRRAAAQYPSGWGVVGGLSGRAGGGQALTYSPAVAEPFSLSGVGAVGGLCSLRAAVGLAARGLVLRAPAAIVLRAVVVLAAVVLFRAVVGLPVVLRGRAAR